MSMYVEKLERNASPLWSLAVGRNSAPLLMYEYAYAWPGLLSALHGSNPVIVYRFRYPPSMQSEQSTYVVICLCYTHMWASCVLGADDSWTTCMLLLFTQAMHVTPPICPLFSSDQRVLTILQQQVTECKARVELMYTSVRARTNKGHTLTVREFSKPLGPTYTKTRAPIVQFIIHGADKNQCHNHRPPLLSFLSCCCPNDFI